MREPTPQRKPRSRAVRAPKSSSAARQGEARLAEDALRRSEARLRAIVETEPECVKTIAADCRLLDMNRAGLAMIEVDSLDAVAGKSILPLILPEHRAAFESMVARVFRGEKCTLEFEISTARGARRWMESHAVPLRDERDAIVAMLSITRDVTRAKRADEERRLLQELTLAVSEAADFHAALGIVMRKLCDVTGWILGQAWIPRSDVPLLECSPVHCCADERLEPYRKLSEESQFAPGVGLPGRVWESKQALWVQDIYDGSGLVRPHFPRGLGVKAAMGIPVLAGDEVAAVMEFYVLEPRVEAERRTELATMIAVQLGSLIQRKRIEEQLRLTEKKYRSMFENAVEGIFQSTPEGRFITVNPALARFLGYASPEELVASITDIRHQLYVDPVRRDVFQRKLEQLGYVTGFEYEAFARDGRRIWIAETARAVRDGEGRLLYYEGTFVDITERKRAEEALRESEERYRELVENAHDVIFVVDLKGSFLSVNAAGERISGYTRDEMLRMNVEQIVPPEYRGPLRTILETSRGNAPAIQQLELDMKDGRRVAFEISARVLRHRGRAVAIEGIARDLTERKHLEEQLRQAQKMEAIGSLAGGVAHDFNNLLTAIIGYSELLMGNVTDDRLRRDVEEIKRAGERAASLTRQLLAFSRRQVLQPKVLDLNAVIADMDNMIRRLIGEDIRLVTALDASLSKVKADPTQIEQVILNLAVNARDAMPRGGVLTIGTGCAKPDDSLPRAHGVAPGNWVILSVRDTGVGIHDDAREHIFEPFFTTKDLGKGTGLGLSTVYGIVKQSGGTIGFDSAIGRGTTFTIYLPATEQEAQVPIEADATNDPARGTETVLLVEDEETIRTLARNVLQMRGYTVLVAGNGNDALAVAERHAERIDLLLTDVVMPEMGGPELARRLAASRPDTRVLYMSGYTEAAVHKDVLEAEQAFLMKPFTPSTLASKVRSVLDRPGAPGAKST